MLRRRGPASSRPALSGRSSPGLVSLSPRDSWGEICVFRTDKGAVLPPFSVWCAGVSMFEKGLPEGVGHTYPQLQTVDHLARRSMKNAANCVKQGELQGFMKPLIVERILRPWLTGQGHTHLRVD